MRAEVRLGVASGVRRRDSRGSSMSPPSRSALLFALRTPRGHAHVGTELSKHTALHRDSYIYIASQRRRANGCRGPWVHCDMYGSPGGGDRTLGVCFVFGDQLGVPGLGTGSSIAAPWLVMLYC